MSYLVIGASLLILLLGMFLHPQINKSVFQQNNWLKDLENAAPLVGLIVIILSGLMFIFFIIHIISEIKWFLLAVMSIGGALIGTLFIKEKLIQYEPMLHTGRFLKDTALRIIEMFNIEENPATPAFLAILLAVTGIVIAFFF